jgi:predicted ArsR family transcriptional regulator
MEASMIGQSSSQKSATQIVCYLTKTVYATSQQISQALGMTNANIHYHLKLLASQGIVESFKQKEQRGRGRPSLIYHLSESYNRDNYTQLLSNLLSLFVPPEGKASSEPVPWQIVALAEKMFPPPNWSGKSTIKILNETVKRLNEHAYKSRWEARKTGARVIFQHCPYRLVRDEHQEICQLDTVILQTLTQREISRDLTIDFSDPTSACVFSLGKTISPTKS